eukprot:6472082-Amphidinium_carterae.2
MEMIRGPNGNVDATLSFDWHIHKRDLGTRSRELTTTKVALKNASSHISNKDKPSALAAGASRSPRKPSTSWTCKYFTSDEGCKKGEACDAKHIPKDKAYKDSGDRRRPQANAADQRPSSDSRPKKPDPKKPITTRENQVPRAKAKKSAKSTPRRPKAREAAVEELTEEEDDDEDEEQTSPEQTSAEESSESASEQEQPDDEESQEESSQSSVGAMAIVTCEDDVQA